MAVIGFDLDLTLVESSRAILWSVDRALADYGLEIPLSTLENSIGLPLLQTLNKFVPDSNKSNQVFETYKEYYSSEGFKLGLPMPGAKEALASLQALGHKIVVITAKSHDLAEKQLRYCELTFNHLEGNCFGIGKTKAIVKTGVEIYVGDHIEDYKSSIEAGVPFVGFNSKPNNTLEEIPQSERVFISKLSDLIPIIPALIGR